MEKRVTEGLADLIFQSGEASFPRKGGCIFDAQQLQDAFESTK